MVARENTQVQKVSAESKTRMHLVGLLIFHIQDTYLLPSISTLNVSLLKKKVLL